MNSLVERSRFRPAVLAAVALVGTGVLTGEPVALFAATIPLTLIAVGSLVTDPPASPVSVDRTLSTDDPAPGEPVTVRVTVTNETDRHLPDVRITDGVPTDAAVIDGSPRGHATLAPGETTTVRYDLRVPRGETRIDSPTITVRSLAGTSERRVDPDVTDRLRTRVESDAVPLDDQTARITGRVETDDPGEGLAFNSSRAYQPGDPLSRIDWNAYAATGELRTTAFDEERAATVVVVVDDRRAARVVARPGEADAARRARHAATRLADAMLAAGDRVGVAIKGRGDSYLSPGRGETQTLAVRRLLAERDGVPDSLSVRRQRWYADELADWLPASAQVVFCTPLVDDEPVDAAERWMARGHPVTVLAPDPLAETPGGRVARLARRERRDELRRAGARVVNWDGDELLAAAVDRAEVAWR